MRIVIDISEEDYGTLININDDRLPSIIARKNLDNALADCIILPEGCGRLIDANAYEQDIRKHCFDNRTVIRCTEIALSNAPTIIDASEEQKMTTELKPCPFCGRAAILKQSPHIPKGTDYTPTCTEPSCAGRLTKIWTDKEKAINAWNKRAE